MSITKQQIRAIHALLSKAAIMDQKETILASYDCDSMKDLTTEQARHLIVRLKAMAKKRLQPMRNTIIHYLCLLGYEKNGKPDYERINKFIQGVGSRNPRKKILNFLTYKELQKIVTQVKAMYKTELQKS